MHVNFGGGDDDEDIREDVPGANPDEYFEPDEDDDMGRDSSDELDDSEDEQENVEGVRERTDRDTFEIQDVKRRVRSRHMVIMARYDGNVRDRVSYYGLAMKYEPLDTFFPQTELTLECTEARWFNERVVNEG